MIRVLPLLCFFFPTLPLWAGAPVASPGFTQSFFPGGLRTGAGSTFALFTPHYGLEYDYTRLALVGLFPIPRPLTEEDRFRPDWPALASLSPAVALRFEVHDGEGTLTGHPFTNAPVGAGTVNNCHLVTSGTFEQRRYQPIRWDGTAGASNLVGGLETVVWPDRLSFRLHLSNGAPRGRYRVSLSIAMGKPFTRTPGPGHGTFRRPEGHGFVVLAAEGPLSAVDHDLPAFAARAEGSWPKDKEVTVGLVLRPLAVKGGAGPETMAEEERTPLVVEAQQTSPSNLLLAGGWEKQDGTVTVRLRNDDGKIRERLERVLVLVSNPSPFPRVARLAFEKTRDERVAYSTGVGAVICDEGGHPTGIGVQVSKNWHARKEFPKRFEGPWLKNLTALNLPAHGAARFEYVGVSGYWQGAPAASYAQLCLVGWGFNQGWDQAALGAWGETLCVDVDQHQTDCYVADVRPFLVAYDEKRQWGWPGNMGGGDLFRFFDATGRRVRPGAVFSSVVRNGPLFTTAIYDSTTEDGSMSTRFSASLVRADDLPRVFFHLSLKALKDIAFSRFVFFQISADTYASGRPTHMARGNAKGLLESWATTWGRNATVKSGMAADGDAPWFALKELDPTNKSGLTKGNRGIIIRSWNGVLGGKPSPHPWAAEYSVNKNPGRFDSSLLDIVPPADLRGFRAGDFIEADIEMVVPPMAAEQYYGPNAVFKAEAAHPDFWHLVEREARGNRLVVTAARGRVLSTLPLEIALSNGGAEFTLEGGVGWVPLIFTGAPRNASPVLEQEKAGGWEELFPRGDSGATHQARLDPATGLYEIIYALDMDRLNKVEPKAPRRFRFRI